MKKHNILALVGTLALLANLLVPGLASADTAGQSGTVSLTCLNNSYSFSVTPARSFDFKRPNQTDGTTFLPNMYSSTSVQYAFNNVNGTDLNVSGNNHDYVEVQDQRDPSDPSCNTGLTVTLHAINPGHATQVADTRYFDDADGTAAGHSIPLNTTYVLTSAHACPAGSTVKGGDVCFDNTALCGKGSGVQPGACDGTEGLTAADYSSGTAFATLTSFPANGKLGSAADTAADIAVLGFASTHELYGKAGVGVTYGTTIPAGQPSGVYTLNLEYVLSAT